MSLSLSTFFYLAINSISLNGQALPLPSSVFVSSSSSAPSDVIISSGSPFTQLPSAAYTALVSQVRGGGRGRGWAYEAIRGKVI